MLSTLLIICLRAESTGLSPSVTNNNPESKVNMVNMGPTWGQHDPGGPHVAPWTLLSGELWWFLYHYLAWTADQTANLKFPGIWPCDIVFMAPKVSHTLDINVKCRWVFLQPCQVSNHQLSGRLVCVGGRVQVEQAEFHYLHHIVKVWSKSLWICRVWTASECIVVVYCSLSIAKTNIYI